MTDELFTFQKRAQSQLRRHCHNAHREYETSGLNQVVSFTAPTGSGKTIIMSALIEDILFGNEEFEEQPQAIFVWLSDSPELNQQSKEKIDQKADRIRLNQTIILTEDTLPEVLSEGHIYFLNTQKLSRTSNMTTATEQRSYTVWDTLSRTVATKADRLYFIIDEAHRGMKGNEAGRATTIMQKFILGSEKDGLPPIPVVIGMSATIERFNQLVKNSTATSRPVKVLPEEVRASGLLKDRVIITYPKDASEQKDMAVLQAATDEWVSKCQHWETYCREQHHWMVNPVMVVQVLNGTGDRLSDTDLDECLQKIEQRSGLTFQRGEVVHAFSDKRGVVKINNLEVPYEEPSKISDNKRVRLVFFKEALSTGWDCPRAETMMSFRRYTDATAIAQLLGRMVRTPIQKHIMVDDMLNDVRLFLPHFDAKKVGMIVDELQRSEGGELPTDVIEDELEHGTYRVLTVKTRHRHQSGKPDMSLSLFSEQDIQTAAPQTAINPKPKPRFDETPSWIVERDTAQQSANDEPDLGLEYDGIDRERIVGFINDLSLPTYYVRSFRQSGFLQSLFRMTNFLLLSGLDIVAKSSTLDEIVEMIHQHVHSLKNSGKYTTEKEQVLNFEMLSEVYDAFGERIQQAAVMNLFSETDVELDRQLRMAEKKLGNEGVSNSYIKKYDDPDHQELAKIDVILYAGSEDCLLAAEEYAKKKFHALNDQYRQKTVRLTDHFKTEYRNLIRDSEEVTQTPFFLSDNIAFRSDEQGAEYGDHLFVDGQTGTVRIRLNGWEERVIEEERQRDDYRCWYRNPSRGREALAIPYQYKGTWKLFYPDFLVVRREAGGDYILDILEPHDPTRDDNIGKAKALAKYASDNPAVGRAQLIRLMDTITGKQLKRLDFAAHSELRQKIAQVSLPDELDMLFNVYGE